MLTRIEPRLGLGLGLGLGPVLVFFTVISFILIYTITSLRIAALSYGGP